MQKPETENAKSHPRAPQTLSGLLASSLDMEDEMAHSIYRDYLERKSWPVELKDEVFEEIRKHLTRLLADTQRHRKMIKHLQSQLDQQDE